MPVKVILAPNQKRHGKNNFNSCIKHGHFADGSGTGTGKTPNVFALAQRLSKHHGGEDVYICVVGPGTSIRPSSFVTDGSEPLSPWEREARRYEYEHCYIESYETLRGQTVKATARSTPIKEYPCGDFIDMDGNNLLSDYYLHGKDFDECYADLIEESKEYANDDHDYKLSGNVHEWSYSDDHCLLTKIDTINVEKKRKKIYEYNYSYAPTMAWLKFCEDNIVLLIFDEAHLAKNDSQQNNSCAALIRGVRRAFVKKGGTGCYFGTLTASPLDKKKHTNSYFKLNGTHDPLAHHDMIIHQGPISWDNCYYEAKRYDLQTARTIAKKYGALVEKKTKESKSKDGNRKGRGSEDDTNHKKLTLTRPKNEQEFIADLWIECVLANVHSAMIDITEKILCNAFFKVRDEEDLQYIKKAHSLLTKSAELRDAGRADSAFKLQNESTMWAERGMAKIIAEKGYKRFKMDKDNKVVIAFNHVAHVEAAYKHLLTLGVMEEEMGMIKGSGEMDIGKSPAARKRDKHNNIELFQRSRRFRILIITIKSGGLSIALHDLVGQRKRYGFICMSDDMTAQQQFVGRMARFGTQSVPEIFICYPEQFGPEALKIYSRNVQKSKTMRRALESVNDRSLTENEKIQLKLSIRLPGEYDRYFDPPSEEFMDRAYLWDNPVWIDSETFVGLYPAPEEHGFVEEDTKEGRRRYNDHKYMIKYVRSIWEQDIAADDIYGIKFLDIVDKTVNQFPVEKYPSVRLIEEID